jgi:hypothetical protein
MPTRGSWEGQFIDGGIGDAPVGPLFARVGPAGTVYAAWTEFLSATGEFPLTLAVHGRDIFSDFVLYRAVTAGLALTPRGPVVAANEWVSQADLGFDGDALVWAGIVAGPRGARAQLDGRIAGLAGGPLGRELLLSRGGGLSWYRMKRRAPRVTLRGTAGGEGVVLTGRVRGVAGGTVAIYRERPGRPRQLVRNVAIGANGSFRLVDRGAPRLRVYRAVYVDRMTGIPYAFLLRQAVS